MDERETPQEINEYEDFVSESGVIFEPIKSELDDYLAEKLSFLLLIVQNLLTY